ncbi:hypothetical protein V8E52_000752 [Russula decolorans]
MCKFEVYVEEVASADQIFGPVCVSIGRIQGSILNLRNVVNSRPEDTRNRISPRAKTNMAWSVRLHKAPTGARVLVNKFREAVHAQREYSCILTGIRLDILRVTETPGTTFKDKIRFKFP